MKREGLLKVRSERSWADEILLWCAQCEACAWCSCRHHDLSDTGDVARWHAREAHACPSWRASGERCTDACTDCGGRGWVS